MVKFEQGGRALLVKIWGAAQVSRDNVSKKEKKAGTKIWAHTKIYADIYKILFWRKTTQDKNN